jgi:hypothetical protein
MQIAPVVAQMLRGIALRKFKVQSLVYKVKNNVQKEEGAAKTSSTCGVQKTMIVKQGSVNQFPRFLRIKDHVNPACVIHMLPLKRVIKIVRITVIGYLQEPGQVQIPQLCVSAGLVIRHVVVTE